MKKSLSIVLVLILTAIGAEALASMLDMQVNKVVSETNDKGGTDNKGGRYCSTKPEK